METTQKEQQLRSAVQLYFDGLYNGNLEQFSEVFHPDARLFSTTEGKLASMDREQYFALVRERPSAASRGDRREDEILSLTVSSPTTAHVRVCDLYLPKHFVDELVFVYLDERWQIITKVYHFELE
jgi:hypothetical protein